MTQPTLVSNDPPDPIAMAFARRAMTLQADLGAEPMQLAAAGLALALIDAAARLDPEIAEPVLRRA